MVFPVSRFRIKDLSFPAVVREDRLDEPSLFRATTSTSSGVLEELGIRHLGHTGRVLGERQIDGSIIGGF
jgi:hypothetical protein